MSTSWAINLGLTASLKTHWMESRCNDEARRRYQCTQIEGLTFCSDDANTCNTLSRTLTVNLVLAALEM